jgi:hypothetical protein
MKVFIRFTERVTYEGEVDMDRDEFDALTARLDSESFLEELRAAHIISSFIHDNEYWMDADDPEIDAFEEAKGEEK